MSSFVDFTDSDLLRNKILPPDWYKVSIDEVEPWKPSKNGQTNNKLFSCTVLCNATTGEEEGIAGIPIYIQLNDSPKAKGFIEAFLRVLGIDVQPGTRYDLDSAVGKVVTAFIENETYEGRVRNRIN